MEEQWKANEQCQKCKRNKCCKKKCKVRTDKMFEELVKRLREKGVKPV